MTDSELNHIVSGGRPFIFARLPGKSTAEFWVESEDGNLEFILCPFDGASIQTSMTSVEIPEDFFPTEEPASAPQELVWDSSQYEQSFELMMKELKAEHVQKVVLASSAALPWDGDRRRLFSTLCRDFPSAFIHWWKDGRGEEWIGASPEPLLRYGGERYSTASLAGTRGVKQAWSAKEVLEQSLVTDHIMRVLDKLNVDELEQTGPYDYRSGELIHIRTDISFAMQNNQISELIADLHPTPAVCGLPRQRAYALIHKAETSPRGYYCGYIGMLAKGRADYFVNLRCARISDDGVEVFAGGGLLASSDLEAEKAEVLSKMNTIASRVSSSV